jgi:hypothetical protein
MALNCSEQAGSSSVMLDIKDLGAFEISIMKSSADFYEILHKRSTS